MATLLLHSMAFSRLISRSHCVRSVTIVRLFKSGRGTGDKGQTSLFSNERRWKDDAVFDVLGSTDELSCLLGMCVHQSKQRGLFNMTEVLTKVQCGLQDVGSHVATPPSSTKTDSKLKRAAFDANLVSEVNSLVDQFDAGLPPLKNFILPGGGDLGCQLHLARSVCRRTERRLVTLMRDDPSYSQEALRFLNRLSDLLFVLARYACKATGDKEAVYVKPSDLNVMTSWTEKQL